MASAIESVRAGFRASIRNSRSIDRCWAEVRSSSVTPTRAGQSIWEMRILSMAVLPVGLVERFAPGKSRLDIVPEGDGVFPQVPAQINDPSMPQVGKVAEALVDVLYVHPHVLNLIQQVKEVRRRFHIGRAVGAEAVERDPVADLLDLRIDPAHQGPLLARFAQQRPELRDQPAGFR